MKDFIAKIKAWWIAIPNKTVIGKIISLLRIALAWMFKQSGRFAKWIYAPEVLSIAMSIVIFKKVTAFWGIILFCLSVYLLMLSIYRDENK